MNELHQYLDGELALEALPDELRGEAARWDALLDAVAELGNEVAPPWLETAIMARLPERRSGAAARALSWLLRPRAVQVRPVFALALAAILVLGASLWQLLGPDDAASFAAGAAGADPVVYVQFVYAGPADGSVSVAGDFNQWQPDTYMLSDADGDGVWTGFFPVSPGVHKYMFVVNGQEWVTDPRAQRYVDDGFGMRNAILSVSAGRAL